MQSEKMQSGNICLFLRCYNFVYLKKVLQGIYIYTKSDWKLNEHHQQISVWLTNICWSNGLMIDHVNLYWVFFIYCFHRNLLCFYFFYMFSKCFSFLYLFFYTFIYLINKFFTPAYVATCIYRTRSRLFHIFNFRNSSKAFNQTSKLFYFTMKLFVVVVLCVAAASATSLGKIIFFFLYD